MVFMETPFHSIEDCSGIERGVTGSSEIRGGGMGEDE